MATRIREKALAYKENSDKRPKAIAKNIRLSASKARIVIDIIRGLKYTDAIAVLQATPKAASPYLIKLLNSAAANAENNQNLAKNDLFVAEIFANEGRILKRSRAVSKGRIHSIFKRTCSITVILDVASDK